MNCPNCKHINLGNAKFCNNCGDKLLGICAECEAQNPDGAKFCNECGKNLTSATDGTTSKEFNTNQEPDEKNPKAKAAERRQLTCLFCDLVGSTTIASLMDAEDYRQYILDYQMIAEEVIKRHQGHVGNYLGDGLLVYFGYPIGLENAPRTAVQCSLAIIDAIAKHYSAMTTDTQKVQVRMGIHTGLVVVDEQMALGSTVNIAARLEGLAETNTVVISEDIKKLVEGWFDVGSLGSHTLKGISQPMVVFQVLKERGAETRLEISRGRGLSPLVGREDEVYMLLRSWNQAKSGNGQLVLLNGETGIGKSRLVDSIKGQVKQEPNVAKLELRCSDHHVNSPFYPIVDLFERIILDFEKEDTYPQKVEKLKNWIDNVSGLTKTPYLPIYADFLSIAITDKLRAKHENPLLAPAAKRKKFMDGFVPAIPGWKYPSSASPQLSVIMAAHQRI